MKRFLCSLDVFFGAGLQELEWLLVRGEALSVERPILVVKAVDVSLPRVQVSGKNQRASNINEPAIYRIEVVESVMILNAPPDLIVSSFRKASVELQPIKQLLN